MGKLWVLVFVIAVAVGPCIDPFKHLFLCLLPCQPPVEILTGNGYVYSYFYGTIPLVLLVEGQITHIVLLLRTLSLLP